MKGLTDGPEKTTHLEKFLIFLAKFLNEKDGKQALESEGSGYLGRHNGRICKGLRIQGSKVHGSSKSEPPETLNL